MSNLVIPGGQFSEKWTQQIHRDCGGEIVVIVQVAARKFGTVCKGCKYVWDLGVVEGFPDRWETPLRIPERLIIPNSNGKIM